MKGDVGNVWVGQDVTFTVDAYPARRFQGTVQQVRNAAIMVQNVVTYDAVVGVDNKELLLKPGMTANVEFLVSRKTDVLKIPNAALRFRPPSERQPAGAGGGAGQAAGGDAGAEAGGGAGTERRSPNAGAEIEKPRGRSKQARDRVCTIRDQKAIPGQGASRHQRRLLQRSRRRGHPAQATRLYCRWRAKLPLRRGDSFGF